METQSNTNRSLAAAITKSASKQTYYTIRLFADRERSGGAYQAYAYFRWVDNVLDETDGAKSEKLAFITRQKTLLEACYRGETPNDVCAEERMLVELVHSDTDKDSGLHAYLHNMMDVMIFDARRRGQVITQAELSGYSCMLATAVTEAMFYFIGHDDPTPHHETRYLAVTAAHMTHMLRDALEDTNTGYFNISREYLQTAGISPHDVESRAYQEWVRDRVRLARRYFKVGRKYLARVKNLRCRMAGYAYTARFEWMLRLIECDNYCLRYAYPERNSLLAGLWIGWSTLASFFTSPKITAR